MSDVQVFPDAEILALYLLGQEFPSYRFSTSLPGDISATTVRIHRISGAARSIGTDRPIIDIDVFGPDHAEVARAAREIQAEVMGWNGISGLNGVVQSTTVIAGPRQLPEANQSLVRYGATYELLTHS